MQYFYVDDTSIRVLRINHRALVGLFVSDTGNLFDRVASLRLKHAVPPYSELKSAVALLHNADGFLEDLASLINTCSRTTFMVISSNNNSDHIASLLLDALGRYCRSNNLPAYYLLADEGIVRAQLERRLLAGEWPECIGVQSLRSKYDFGIQLADWTATLMKSYINAVLSRAVGQVLVTDSGQPVWIDFNSLVQFALRYRWWGDVLTPTGEEVISIEQQPFLHILGRSIIIDSSPEVRDALEPICKVFMGCIH